MKKFCLLLLTSILLMACSQDENVYQPPPPPEVTVDKPLIKDITEYSYFTGTTSAYNSVDLQAQVSGYLQKINFKSGELVDKGDLLFVIDPLPYQAELDQAKADLEIKKADLQLASTTLERRQKAYKNRAISELDVIEAKAQKAKAQAAVQASKARVKTASINVDYTHIHAPFKGRVSRNLVDTGNLIKGSTLLGTVINSQPIYAYFDISETEMLKFMEQARVQNSSTDNPEQGVRVDLALSNEQGYPHQGKIDYASTEVDKSTGTIQVRAVFPNKDHFLIPGMFVKLRLPVQKIQDALLVPDAALGADQRGSYLLTVDKNNQVQYIPVETGPEVEGMRVIKSGLKARDRIVVKGLQRARPGSKVSPQTDENKNASSGVQQ